MCIRDSVSMAIGCGFSSISKSGSGSFSTAKSRATCCALWHRLIHGLSMRILWVKMGGLWPANTGGRVRSLQIISALSRRHRVTLVTTHGLDDDPSGLSRQLPDCHRIHSIPFAVPKKGDRRFPLALARSWLSADPVDLWKWRVGQVRELVTDLIADNTADVCVSDFLFAAANVPMRGKVPVVLFEHNVEYLIWQRLSAI